MSEDADAARPLTGRDPLLAASLAAANTARYDDLISRQVRLADLQIENLEKQDEYQLSHLRWRRFNDQVKGMLQITRKSDLDGAISKFETANQKGPHFADPLEIWGEALIAKNRSDLAVPKFAEANKYAPNWGRLHLKWGEALLWSGDEVGAATQFAAASHLDLTSSEKSQLGRMQNHNRRAGL